MQLAEDVGTFFQEKEANRDAVLKTSRSRGKLTGSRFFFPKNRWKCVLSFFVRDNDRRDWPVGVCRTNFSANAANFLSPSG